MLKYIKDKIIEFLIDSVWTKMIMMLGGIVIGSYFSSNYFVNLIINKQYSTLFIVTLITVIIVLLTIILCYSFIYVLKINLEKYYYRKEKHLTHYKLKTSMKKEKIKSKVSTKKFFSMENDDIPIYYKRNSIQLDLDLINKSENTSIEIIFTPILKEDYIKNHIENEVLKELNYYCVKETVGRFIGHYSKFEEELFDILYLMDYKSEKNEEPSAIMNMAFKYKIKNELLEDIESKYRVKTEIDNFKFEFEENYIDDNSELIMKFYFKNKMVDQKIIKLSDLLKNEYLNIEFSKEIFKNI